MIKKSELIKEISSLSGSSQAEVARVYDALFTAFSTNLKKGKKITVLGFGTLATKKRAARNGRNPSTGKEMQIPAATAIVFKPSSRLKELVND